MSSEFPELLWITPKWPFPSEDGARVATTRMLSALTKRGVKIHLRSVISRGERPDPNEAREVLGVESTAWVEKPHIPSWRRALMAALNPRAPVTLIPYDDPLIRKTAARWIAEKPGTAVIYDGLHAGVWALSSQDNFPGFYRAHNIEADLWKALSRRRSGLSRTFLQFQSESVEEYERKLIGKSLAVFPVSETDCQGFRQADPEALFYPIPIGLPERDRTQSRRDFTEILFVGKLDWAPNREGLSWFLDHVWPGVMKSAPHLKLTLVGSGKGDWLERYAKLPGLNRMGRVEDVSVYYDRAGLSIIPVFWGSGTRVKAIEAAMHGCACLSTSLGTEGTPLVPGESYLRAESAESWIEVLSALKEAELERIAETAFQKLRRVYDADQVAAEFIGHIQRVLCQRASGPEFASVPAHENCT